jgi:hypothetical protein
MEDIDRTFLALKRVSVEEMCKRLCGVKNPFKIVELLHAGGWTIKEFTNCKPGDGSKPMQLLAWVRLRNTEYEEDDNVDDQ